MKALKPLLLKRNGSHSVRPQPFSEPASPVRLETGEAGRASPVPPPIAGVDDTTLLLSRFTIGTFSRLYRSGAPRSPRWKQRFDGPLPAIHRLPFELIAEILYECARDSPNTVVHLSHVDSRLRQIAFACPLLWTTLQLTGPSSFSKCKAYLQRSLNLPLDIRLIYTSERIPDVLLYVAHVNDFRRLFTELLAHGSRWRSLHLDIRDYDLMYYAARSLPTHLPLMERIILRCRTAPPSTSTDNSFALFEDVMSPKLRHVDLESINARWNRPFLHQLETFRLVRSAHTTPETSEQIFQVLRASPRLRRLHLEMTHTACPDEYQAAVHLPKLDTLILWKVNPDFLGKILCNLRVPQLKVFEVQFTSSRRNWSLVNLIGSPSFPLHSLYLLGIGYWDWEPEMIYSLLRRLPHLKGLRIVGGALPHSLLFGLASRFRGTDQAWLCARLETLQIKYAEVTDEEIIRVLSRRQRSRSTVNVRSVWVGSCPHVSGDFEANLRALQLQCSAQVVP